MVFYLCFRRRFPHSFVIVVKSREAINNALIKKAYGFADRMNVFAKSAWLNKYMSGNTGTCCIR